MHGWWCGRVLYWSSLLSCGDVHNVVYDAEYGVWAIPQHVSGKDMYNVCSEALQFCFAEFVILFLVCGLCVWIGIGCVRRGKVGAGGDRSCVGLESVVPVCEVAGLESWELSRMRSLLFCHFRSRGKDVEAWKVSRCARLPRSY